MKTCLDSREGGDSEREELGGNKACQIAKDKVFQQSRRDTLLAEDMQSTWQCR